MKYKVGDKVRFVKDCVLMDSKAIPSKSVWVVRSVEEGYYLFERVGEHLVVMIGHKLADDNCEKINTAPSITKRINDKHNILNGLVQMDSSELWEGKQMPKFKPKTKVVFTEDYRIAFGCVHKNTKGEVLGIEKIGDDDFYYSIAIGDEKKKAHIPVERMDRVCVEDKTQDKHNILNGLLNSDGSVDGEKLMEKLASDSEEAKTKGSHYEKAAMQPLEVMQRIMTTEQFEAFLFGNCLKYLLRKDYKGQRESDEYKARQYAYWLEMVKDGHIINPSKDKVPSDYRFSII